MRKFLAALFLLAAAAAAAQQMPSGGSQLPGCGPQLNALSGPQSPNGCNPQIGGPGAGGVIPPPVACGTGTIDASEGCPLPMMR